MSVYSVRFLALQGVTPAGNPFLGPVVAVNQVAVCRDISLIDYMPGTTAGQVYIEDASGHTYGFFSFGEQSTPTPYPSYHWVGRQVLQPGERLGMYVQAGEVSGDISGYLLSNY